MEKPTLPKGTRDFGPAVMAKRQYIFNTIRSVFQKFGFQPLETPAMENIETLTGKYGEEGDQLLFRILDSGDFFEDLKEDIKLSLSTSGTQLRELFDAVDFRLGQNKIRPKEEIERLVVQAAKEIKEKHTESKVSIKEIILKSKHHVADAILSRYQESPKGENSIDLAINFFKSRNEKVENLQSSLIRSFITEKGLRYDLTVPFARYVVMNRNEVSFPFKRYQIQPVWRADRPQKGRYREFYQCDADVVGTNSLICEAEIILMIKDVFKNLNITDYDIKINHRQILNGVAEVIGASGNETALFVAIDKLDKIGEENVKTELKTKGFADENLRELFDILNVKGSIINKMTYLFSKFEPSSPGKGSEQGKKGLRDLQEVINLLESYGADTSHVEFDVALARGLSYYTGCIFEVKINNVGIGSVSGGGRYDNLTQAFGDKENLSGVGFSFGVDRIYDAMEELSLFPKDSSISSKVLICHFDEASMRYGLGVLTKLREKGIASEIYPDSAKIKKQLDYGNKKSIPYTIVIGSDEMNTGQLAFKNMETGVQEKLRLEDIIPKIK